MDDRLNMDVNELHKVVPGSDVCLDWIDAYVAEALSEDKREAFEDFLMAHPQLVADIEAAELLHGLKGVNIASNAQAEQVPSDVVTKLAPRRPWIKQPLSIAAALALAVSLTLNLADFGIPDVASDGYGISGEIQLGTLRGSTVEQVDFLAGSRLLTIDLGPDTDGEANIEVSASDGEIMYLLDSVPSQHGLVMVVVPTLPVGSYRGERQPGWASRANSHITSSLTLGYSRSTRAGHGMPSAFTNSSSSFFPARPKLWFRGASP